MLVLDFINKLESVYDKKYNEIQIELMQKKLKFYSEKTFEYAVGKLLERYATLPSLKNIIEACESDKSQPTSIDIRNKFEAKDFGVTKAYHNVWFAPLQIDIRDNRVGITPPIIQGDPAEMNVGKPNRFFEDYVMNNLKENLLKALPNDIEEIIWNYSEHYANKIYKKEDGFTKSEVRANY